MIYDDIAQFAAALPAMRSLVGLDFGEKTIGIAVSDTFRSVASPLTTIRRKKFTLDAQALMEIVQKRDIAGLVMGLPRNMDGSEGARCQKSRAFVRNLAREFAPDLAICFWDERLSTVAAERAMLESDTSRARRAELIDQVAAGYILQGALDRLSHIGRAT
ncbi:Putative Holliday junction resolvase [Aquimixticola soesokkakensis]|uniref:Putative pre-16S rRNA nuclease n=1 Tax=Aquimixticola soesokkakensis TaxID=1519096 RepID=A0A1Y5SKD8_9RHOB|nr:Holliday junction resolvase RuvX [Aquimixticola soesokkakensis]SLN42205.1 Putative Holliday junction resolvase [Aquimixticola soesokkakensis]